MQKYRREFPLNKSWLNYWESPFHASWLLRTQMEQEDGNFKASAFSWHFCMHFFYSCDIASQCDVYGEFQFGMQYAKQDEDTNSISKFLCMFFQAAIICWPLMSQKKI